MDKGNKTVEVGDQLLGKYTVDRVLGQGGMGVVVLASHMVLRNQVAIKFLLPEACDHPGAVERFLREARAAVQIQSEHVARVSDVGTLDTGLPYMVMEYLEGVDLADELEARHSLPIEQAAEILLQSLEAIGEAHSLGIVHRDLKPANLFLATRKDGTRIAKVLDFGISKAVQPGEANLTQTSSMMGSPLYMAPEQIRNAKTVDARADIWSLGVILHECLAGSQPFGGTTLSGVLAAIVADPPEPLAQLRPELPVELTNIVARCLEKNVNERVQNVVELAELLAPFCPEQAQRSIPRIRAVLGTTLKQGTDASLAATGISTQSQGTPAGRVATESSLEDGKPKESPASSLTAQTWAATGGTPGLKPRRPFVPLILAVATVAALGIGAVVIMGGASSEEEPDPAAVSEGETVKVPESEAPVAAPPTEPAPKAPEEKPPEPAPEPAEEKKPSPQPVAAPRPAPAPRAPAPQPRPVATPQPRPVAAPRPAPAPSPRPPAPSNNPLDGRW